MENIQNVIFYSSIPRNYSNPKLGKLIHEARKKQFISQEELSEKAGINRMYLSRLENGKRPIIDLIQAKKFSDILDIPLEKLVETIKLVEPEENVMRLENYFPYIETKKQKDAIERFASLVTRSGLTDEQLDHMLTQAIAYAQYCSNLK